LVLKIKPSPTSEIRRLIEALGAGDEIKREAAIARLAVIGRRAVDRLAAIYSDPSTSRDKRVAILRVLETTGDSRGLAVARRALQEGGDVAVAAAAALRRLLDLPDADISAAALDALVATALDVEAERRVRLAALDALQGMPEDVRTRVSAALDTDVDHPPKSRAGTAAAGDAVTDALWQDALEGRIPDDPAVLRSAVRLRADSAALGSLQKLVDTVKTREGDTSAGPRAQQWRAARGAIHQALALRGSNVAVYDLRETVAAADGALPPSFVAALQAIGDKSCLEPIAAALSRAAGDERWRYDLMEAFDAIVKRERVPRNAAVMKRIATRWPDAAAVLSMISRTTPRRKRPGRI
jgi:hypothetical protein